MEGIHHDAIFQVLPPNITDRSHFLVALMDKFRPMLEHSRSEKKQVVFCVAVHDASADPTKDLIHMNP